MKDQTQILRGTVQFWDPRAQRGIILSDCGSEFYIASASLLQGFTRPQTGMVVLFKRALRIKHALVACQVLEAA